MANGSMPSEEDSAYNWRPVELPKRSTILKVKVSVGSRVQRGSILCLYKSVETPQCTERLKSAWLGVVEQVCVQAGDEMSPGHAVFFIREEVCRHQVVIKLICAECGKDLKDDYLKSPSGLSCGRGPQLSKNAPQLTAASISMIHNVPELMVSSEVAHGVANRDVQELLNDKKLVLIVDLDQTLIHTTNDDVPSNLKDVFHFQMHNPGPWYHTKLRPGAIEFLQDLSEFFQLHIITFGVRLYAHIIARFLDPDDKFFHNRIMARDEIHCFGSDKTANISSLFPMGDEMVCVIDDRDDVWRYMENVIKVPPYRFFPSTGDINDPKQLNILSNSNKEKSSDSRNSDSKEAKTLQEQADSAEESLSENVESESQGNKDDKTNVKEKRLSSPGKEKRKSQSYSSRNKSKRVRFNLPEVSTGDAGNTAVENLDTEKDPEPEISVGGLEALEKATEDSKCLATDSKTSVENTSTTSSPKKKRRSIFGDDNICEDCENNVKHNCKFLGEESKREEEEYRKEKDKNEAFQLDTNSITDDIVSNLPLSRTNTTKAVDSETTNSEVEWEDNDDFLPHLKRILLKVHEKFYEEVITRREKVSLDAINSDNVHHFKNLVPNVKDIINAVKSSVLKGCVIVFSAVVPTNFPLKRSREFLEATSLGAVVCESIDLKMCTHVIAARHNTHKVSQARKNSKFIKIVSPDWLWACSQRWQRANENDFTLEKYDPARSLKNFWIPNPRSNINLAEQCIENGTASRGSGDARSIPATLKNGASNLLNSNGAVTETSTVSIKDNVDEITKTGESDGSQGIKNGCSSLESAAGTSFSKSEFNLETSNACVESEHELKESAKSVDQQDDLDESSSSSENEDEEADEFDISLIESELFDNKEHVESIS